MSDNSIHMPKDITRRVIIPNSYYLCHICNKLTDASFVVIAHCVWFNGYPCCQDCEIEYKPAKAGIHLINCINKGDDLQGMSLSNPVIIQSWNIES